MWVAPHVSQITGTMAKLADKPLWLSSALVRLEKPLPFEPLLDLLSPAHGHQDGFLHRSVVQNWSGSHMSNVSQSSVVVPHLADILFILK